MVEHTVKKKSNIAVPSHEFGLSMINSHRVKQAQEEFVAAPTALELVPEIVQTLRENFRYQVSPTKSYGWRMDQLRSLREMLVNNRTLWEDALEKDLGYGFLHKTMEYEISLQEIDYAIENLSEWMKPQEQPNPILYSKPGDAVVCQEPYGVVLILSSWTYPISLVVKPLVGAIAAGNCVFIHPSNFAENVSNLFNNLIPQYLDQDCIRCVTGEGDVVDEIIHEKFDYIFFIGSKDVGSKLMKASADKFTPMTIQIASKNPCYIDKDMDLDVAARRIVFGKFLNTGQIYAAPDYLLTHVDITHEFTTKLVETIKKFFGPNPKLSKDYGKIINQSSMDKLKDLIKGLEDSILFGGTYDMENRYFEPTIVFKPDMDSPLMQNEIFGPILPIIPVSDETEAIQIINDRPKPLAVYVFSRDKAIHEKIINETSSGTVSINETILHVAVPTLPWGGIGESGFGQINGKLTFHTFSHEKSVFKHSITVDPSERYPPYAQKDSASVISAWGLPKHQS